MQLLRNEADLLEGKLGRRRKSFTSQKKKKDYIIPATSGWSDDD